MFTEQSQGQGRRFAPNRVVALTIMAACAVPLLGAAARADCASDIEGLMSKRTAAVADVNTKAKAKNGKLDPVAACPRLRVLAAVESQASAYMVKNKEWCNLPSDFVDKMTGSSKRTAGFAAQACGFAAKMKQMQQQQAQQAVEQAPKLPAGPL